MPINVSNDQELVQSEPKVKRLTQEANEIFVSIRKKQSLESYLSHMSMNKNSRHFFFLQYFSFLKSDLEVINK